MQNQAQAINRQYLRFWHPVESADANSRNADFAKHIIGFVDGKVVPERFAFGVGCSIRFTYGTVAKVAQGEKFRYLDQTFTHTEQQLCERYETDSNGDHICLKMGASKVPVVIYEAQLNRELNGERPVLVCVGQNMRYDSLVMEQFKKSFEPIAFIEY